MTHKAFTIKLATYYRENLYDADSSGRKFPNLRLEELKTWLGKNVPEPYLADLFADVITRFKPTTANPLPSLADVIEAWDALPRKDAGPNQFARQAIIHGSKMTPKKIHDMVVALRNKEDHKMWEIDFIHEWEDVAYHYSKILEETQDELYASEYCAKIISGRSLSDKVDIDIEEKPDMRSRQAEPVSFDDLPILKIFKKDVDKLPGMG